MDTDNDVRHEGMERRNTASEVRLGDGEDSRAVEGYAMLFGVASDGLPFEEVIERGAMEGVIERSNVFALLDHRFNRGILARSKKGVGTLSLRVDGKGLLYRFDAPRTALGDELLEHIRRGEISESSFAFNVAKEEWEQKKDGGWKRTIKEIDRLYDVSPVYDAAYSKTTVHMRGLEAAQKAQDEADKELDAYYADIESMF